MNDFIRCNKVTGVRWLKEPVDHLKIKIKLKPPDDVISLPKFDDYTNESSHISIEQNYQEFSFKWQEKRFSTSEIQRYKDVHNCLTENELKYHELIKTKEVLPSKVFTYIHEDYFKPLPQEKKKKLSSLSLLLDRLNLEDNVGRIENVFGGKTASEQHLFKSQEDFANEDDEWMAMHIVFDNSNYNDESLPKEEATLISLYHNLTNNYLMLSPDVNECETNPYMVETRSGELLGHLYEVSLDAPETQGDDLDMLLSKLYKKWEKKHKHLVNFIMPPMGKRHVYITLELVSASQFDEGDLYIEYHIKLPEGVHSKNTLHGRTHVSTSICMDDQVVWQYGHLIELSLEMDSGLDVQPLRLYLEAISTDFWHRHRTEGYTCMSIQISPTVVSTAVRCIRPDDGHHRRFFIGGCHVLNDVEVLSRPELQNGNYTYTEAGTINIGYTVISQSPLPSVPAHGDISSGASALLLGADAALQKYVTARDRLLHLTRAEL